MPARYATWGLWNLHNNTNKLSANRCRQPRCTNVALQQRFDCRNNDSDDNKGNKTIQNLAALLRNTAPLAVFHFEVITESALSLENRVETFFYKCNLDKKMNKLIFKRPDLTFFFFSFHAWGVCR